MIIAVLFSIIPKNIFKNEHTPHRQRGKWKARKGKIDFPIHNHKDLLCLVQTAYELSWCSHKTGSFTPFASTVPRNADERETWKQSQWEIMMAIPLPHYASIVKDDSKTKASIMSCHSFKSIAAINRPSLYPPPQIHRGWRHKRVRGKDSSTVLKSKVRFTQIS